MIIEVASGAAVVAGFMLLLRGGRRNTGRGVRADHYANGIRMHKHNGGDCLDCRLPPNTVRTDKRLTKKGGGYYPDDRQIRVHDKGNNRRNYHEKAHVIWDLRMSQKQRATFRDLARRDGFAPTRREPGANYREEEEIFAIMYAAHKQGRAFAKPYRAFFRSTLKK